MSGSASIASLKRERESSADVDGGLADRLRRLQKRVEREHAARHEAERLLESKSLELFALNRQLAALNAELEKRVNIRTAQLEQQRQLAEKLVATDYLTNVASRAHYVEQLEASLQVAQLSGSHLGLLLIDIDEFKRINDSLGHVFGDRLLIDVASRLSNLSQPGDIIARLGGDEFAVVFPCSEPEEALQTARRFRTAFAEGFVASGVSIRSSGSMGVALYPDHASNSAELQQFADLALYKVKSTRRGGIALFHQGMLQRFETRRRLEVELRQAVEAGAIDVWYQPIVCVSTGEVEAVEALARWQDSQGDFISPELFIPLAEDCDLISALGRIVLQKSCGAAKLWIDSGRVRALAVNMSAMQMRDPTIVGDVEEVLERTELHPRHLVIEITEGLLLKKSRRVRQAIESLRRSGIRFALDDFGSGYSNLTQLRSHPVSILKIDRSLLCGFEGDPKSQTIYKSIVRLGRELGLQTVGEGVETEDQLSLLTDIGCDLTQGYLTGRPVPAEDLQAELWRSA